jgi:carboxylesterase
MSVPVLPGAEPWSHQSDGSAGILALHGFTGNPSSMRGVAHRFADEGFHVELPRLPGHGTTVEEMTGTRWQDWCGEVLAAAERLRARADHVVVAGLSMGGSLTLWSGLQGLATSGLICVNPAVRPQAPDVLEMLEEMLADGMAVMPAIGSDIADPDVVEIAYDGAPVAPLLSFQHEGLAEMMPRYQELALPLLLVTSRQDHVVDPADSEFLAGVYGGPVEHLWLERSYHVATQDYDRDVILDRSVEFASRVCGL